MALKSKPDDEVRNDVPIEKIFIGLDASEIVRVNLAVPKSTRTAWRSEALKRDISLSELIRQAMKYYANV